MRWNLRLAAANRGIWKASELQRSLAEHGLVISAGKMSGLWSGQPISLKLADLDVICVVLGCQIGELLIPEPDTVTRPGTPAGAAGDSSGGRSPVDCGSPPTRRPLAAAGVTRGSTPASRRARSTCPQLPGLPGLGRDRLRGSVRPVPAVRPRASRRRLRLVRSGRAAAGGSLSAVLGTGPSGPASRRAAHDAAAPRAQRPQPPTVLRRYDLPPARRGHRASTPATPTPASAHRRRRPSAARRAREGPRPRNWRCWTGWRAATGSAASTCAVRPRRRTRPCARRWRSPGASRRPTAGATPYWATLNRNLVMLLSEHSAGEQIRYSDYADTLRARSAALRRTTDVLASLGVLLDDRIPTFSCLAARLDSLISLPTFATDVEQWALALHGGRGRMRARTAEVGHRLRHRRAPDAARLVARTRPSPRDQPSPGARRDRPPARPPAAEPC